VPLAVAYPQLFARLYGVSGSHAEVAGVEKFAFAARVIAKNVIYVTKVV
jgi:hypothetical protein